MQKSFLRTLGLALTVAAILAAPTRSFADIVGGGNPAPPPDPPFAMISGDTLALVIALATT